MRAVLSSPARRRWLGRLVLALVCAALLASLPSSQGGDDAATMALANELATVRARIVERQAANTRLRRDIAGLKNDPRAIEDAARDELGMVYPDELVVRIEVAR